MSSTVPTVKQVDSGPFMYIMVSQSEVGSRQLFGQRTFKQVWCQKDNAVITFAATTVTVAEICQDSIEESPREPVALSHISLDVYNSSDS
ncbi:hypothetical protein RRG08_001091 [Elysia crispata]|uniref:Uncharacterized protein n=1 Tax=Elysia crispata TaxID=231223 RepID=A0AAE1AVS1_9GAST|nr:hypothetical protein RRG08_001091 [Elysia crispata]